MNPLIRALGILLLLAVAAGAVFLTLSGGDPLRDGPSGDPNASAASDGEQARIAGARSAGGGGDQAPTRTEVATDGSGGPRNAPRAQGFRGRIVDPEGTPLEGAEVELLEGSGENLLTATLMAQRNVVVPPVDVVTTGRDGRFEVGVRDILAPSYELRIRHARHAERKSGGLELTPEGWADLGDLTLERGLELSGRITVEGRPGFPIPGALVTVIPTESVTALNPDPIASRGLETRSDASGNYRFENVSAGIVVVRAVAAGFALAERQAVNVDPAQQNRVDLELAKGESITGRIVDLNGAPVAQASLQALSISSRNPLRAAARSGDDGRFEILGLRAGPYQVTVDAEGYVADRRQPIAAGTGDLLFELRPRASVALRVLDAEGRPVTLFDVVLKRYHPADDSFGNIPEARLERVRERDLDAEGLFHYRGVDPGTYAFQLRAADHAKSFSEPFEVPAQGAPPLVEARLLRGATLHGRLYDADGSPLSGARVVTMPSDLADTAFTAMFADLMTFRASRGETTTDAEGRYRFEHLAPADYRLTLSHPEHTTLARTGIELSEGADLQLPDLKLDRGTQLGGTVLVNGAPSAQVRISITSFPDPQDPTRAPIATDAVTDDQGRFLLDQRLPPGRYTARAARLTLNAPLLQILDQQRTKTDFDIQPGQREHELHLKIEDA